MTTRTTTLEAALSCAKCGAKAAYVEELEEDTGQNLAAGEIVLIRCPNRFCTERPSFFCKSCSVRCYRNGLNQHVRRKKHIENHVKVYPATPAQPSINIYIPTTTVQVQPTAVTETFVFPSIPKDNNMNECLDDKAFALDEMDVVDIYNDVIEQELAITHVENGDSPMDISTDLGTTAPSDKFPKLCIKGNEWLVELLKNQDRATTQEIFAAFERPELQHMKNFFVAEHGSGEGRAGGCLIYMCAKGFQKVRDAQIDATMIPSFNEARWQALNMVQYHSMNPTQRQRQAYINIELSQNVPCQSFLKETYVPPYNQLGRVYGATGMHSMYNSLPSPKVIDVNGVAYAHPRAIIALIMALGIPIDDFYVTADRLNSSGSGTVHNVDECKKAVEWSRNIQQAYFRGSKNGAPSSKNGAPIKHNAIVCMSLSDWCDGFDSAKVKSNRNPIVCKTFTISPPKCEVNGTGVTFVVALGLKKAKGWLEVEERFRNDVEELTCSEEPILFYHGVTQKMVPCCFKRFAVLSDKQERNGLTGTLGCGSNLHRCFGVSGNIQTPSCKIAELTPVLEKEARGQGTLDYGWSQEFVEENRNGAFLPSCCDCRRNNVIACLSRSTNGTSNCKNCRDWDLLGERNGQTMKFTAHKDWPISITAGSPVGPPAGRDLFEEEPNLPFVLLSWKMLKQACKFAFYQASRKQNYWTKRTTVAYLKHCGVSIELAGQLYSAARSCCKAKLEDNTDYDRDDRIGNFKFHPAWLSQDLSVQDYIEAIMHQLFLGAASSNFELVEMWLKETPAGAKLGFTTMLNILQVLIKELRVFNLSWLLACPLTGKKGSLGTGSWVAENWVFFTRISPLIYGWCARDKDVVSKYGVDDVSRMTIAFYCFVSRCLSHAGVDVKAIAQTELFMKEFLSALWELDIRVRHKKLNKQTTNIGEKKGTEAWWLKPNYMSLSNLIAMMYLIGPLVLWWDGGGKGERLIQIIKPHITKGVRRDALCFFVNLLDKLFRGRIMEILERRFGFGANNNTDDDDTDDVGDVPVIDVLNEVAGASSIVSHDESTLSDESDEDSGDEDSADDDSCDEEEEDEEEDEHGALNDEAYLSTNEVHGMTKGKTIFVYRNENQLNDALLLKKPIAGIIELNGCGRDGAPKFEFKAVYRKPVKQFARRPVHFKDNDGVMFHGLWCAKIQMEEEQTPSTSSFGDIQAAAQLSAVAIPLSYVVGNKSPDADKYCVITNWWKHRMPDGSYGLLSLEETLYRDIDLAACFREASNKEGGSSGAQFGNI